MEKIKIKLNNTNGKPMWVINNYIKLFCDYYMKLYILYKIFNIDEPSSKIFYLNKSIPENSSDKYLIEVVKANKNKIIDFANIYNKDKDVLHKEYSVLSYEDFDSLNSLLKIDRPFCFMVNKDNNIEYLYDSSGEDAIKITNFTYNSPVEIVVMLSPIGILIIKSIIEIVMEYKKNQKEEIRKNEEHEKLMEIYDIAKEKLKMNNYYTENMKEIKFLFKVFDVFLEMDVELLDEKQ